MFADMPARPGVATLCGAAPSLADHIGSIEGTVFAVNGADRVLIDHGVVPDFCAVFEMRPDVAEELSPHPGVTYLLASCCHPNTFDRLAGFDVVVWHPLMGIGEGPLVKSMGLHGVFVPGGRTVGMRLPYLAYGYGHRDLRIVAMDSSFTGSSHAHKDRVKRLISVRATEDGEDYATTPGLAGQAESWPRVASSLMNSGCRVAVIGDGLLPAVHRKHFGA